jgi:dephospho-CoA kinase
MKVLGLTGGIGMGKSTVAALLERRGLPVLDTDVVAREIVEPGQPALMEIERAFGPDIVGPNGRLRRERLAQIAFGDVVRRRQLEAITHPRIRERWRTQLAAWRKEGHACAVVVIPLLFETGAEDEFDCIVCVACSAATQRGRLLARGWTQEEIARRNAAQWPVEKKVALSHRVLWTEGSLDRLEAQVDRMFNGLSESVLTGTRAVR